MESKYSDWYKKNRKSHIAKCCEPIICECGRTVNKNGLERHLRSNVHREIVGEGLQALYTKFSNNQLTKEEFEAYIAKEAKKKSAHDDKMSKQDQRKEQIKLWKSKHDGPSELEQINLDKQMREEKIQHLIDNGALVVDNPSEEKIIAAQEKLGKRLLISYVTKDDKYRSGGFLTKVHQHYFALMGGGNGALRISFSVQFANVKTLYIRAE